MMQILNPNLVLAAMVIVALAVCGLLALVFSQGGPLESQLTRAGIVTAFAVPQMTALLALLRSDRTQGDVAKVAARVFDHGQQLAAARTRIHGLEVQADAADSPASQTST